MPAILDAPMASSPVDHDRLLNELVVAERQQKQMLQLVQDSLAFSLGAAERLKTLWSQLPRDDIQRFHSFRGEWFRCIDIALESVHSTLKLLPHAARLTGAPLAGSEKLPSVLKELEDYREALDERWETVDDVDCMIQFEKHPLTEEQLQELVRKYPPPASWYEEPDWPRP